MLELVKPDKHTFVERKAGSSFCAHCLYPEHHSMHDTVPESLVGIASDVSPLVWEIEVSAAALILIDNCQILAIRKQLHCGWDFLYRVAKRLKERQSELFGIAFDVDYTDLEVK